MSIAIDDLGDCKTYNDSRDEIYAVRTLITRDSFVGRSIQIFYPPERKEEIRSALSNANISMQSVERNSLRIKVDFLDSFSLQEILHLLAEHRLIHPEFVLELTEEFSTLTSQYQLQQQQIREIVSRYLAEHRTHDIGPLYEPMSSYDSFDAPRFSNRASASVHATQSDPSTRAASSVRMSDMIGTLIGTLSEEHFLDRNALSLPAPAPAHPLPIPSLNQQKLDEIDFSIDDLDTEQEKEQYTNYCCSLSDQVMSDPVYDPLSPQHSFERSWIVHALKIKQENPFNRNHLTADKLVSNSTLKAEIDQFVDDLVAAKSGLKMS